MVILDFLKNKMIISLLVFIITHISMTALVISTHEFLEGVDYWDI